ncbi:unnamed protein product, partial [Larinioides sclopetarius]
MALIGVHKPFPYHKKRVGIEIREKIRSASISYIPFYEHQSYLEADLAILNRGQMTRTTPELDPLLQTSAPHQLED